MAPPQFLSTLVDNGAMDTLYDLVNSLWKRLKRCSNQADLLFSAPVPSRPPPSSTATRPTTMTATITTEQDGRANDLQGDHEMNLSGRDCPAANLEVDPTASCVSQTDKLIEEDSGKCLPDDKENSGAGSSLCFSDDILAGAVLCQAGAAHAYGVSRKEQRKRGVSGAAEGTGGGEGQSGAQAAERGILSGVTVRQGAWAAQRLLKELKAWRHGQARAQGEGQFCEGAGAARGREGEDNLTRQILAEIVDSEARRSWTKRVPVKFLPVIVRVKTQLSAKS